jgi:hypothetical protein
MSYKRGVVWIEILVWIAIGLTVVTFLARIFYWQQIRDAENKFFAWLGVSPGLQEILGCIVVVLGFIYLFSRYGPNRRSG